MSETNSCRTCGSAELHSGTMVGRHYMRFVPDNRRFFSLTQSAAVSATACMKCGVIVLRANPSDIKAMLKEEN